MTTLREILDAAREHKCPTCGSQVGIYSADEGTGSFVPVDMDAIDEQVRELAGALAVYSGVTWDGNNHIPNQALVVLRKTGFAP